MDIIVRHAPRTTRRGTSDTQFAGRLSGEERRTKSLLLRGRSISSTWLEGEKVRGRKRRRGRKPEETSKGRS
jgi:hypothetical protein